LQCKLTVKRGSNLRAGPVNWWEAWGEIKIEGFGGRPFFGGRPNAK